MHPIKNVVVYCGAHDGKHPDYLQSAEDLGKVLLQENIGLVYGSGKAGLMGKVAKTVHEGGGNVVGIISKHLHAEVHDGYGETIITETMHERKHMMAEKVDAFIALPGGFGTMEELLEIITWYQLNLHNKPIGLLNVNNYYDKFLDWIQNSKDEGFITPSINYFVSDSNPKELLKKMKEKDNSEEKLLPSPKPCKIKKT